MLTSSNQRVLIGSAVLIAVVVVLGIGLAAWKYTAIRSAAAASANQPEPTESVVSAIAEAREHSATTTSIGTVVALRSITLRNELAGTVRHVMLEPGQIVDTGTVLVALDVSVEQAELQALQAQADLAETMLTRATTLTEQRARSQQELEKARAERDIAVAQVARTQAVIARKTLRAPFRARVGIADVHPGQYLNEGTELTTLQGVDKAAHVDFTVAQQVAATLAHGGIVQVWTSTDAKPISATVVAIDARVDSTTRNAKVRARIQDSALVPSPGASVRVLIPLGTPQQAVAIPVSALRKGPGGDTVFVLSADASGTTRAHERVVQVNAIVGDEALIDQGVAAGEQVATSGSFKLRDQVLVAIANSPAPAAHGE